MTTNESRKGIKKASNPAKAPPKKALNAPKWKSPTRIVTAKKPALKTIVAKFPRHPVEKALRIPKAIFDQNAGKASTAVEAARWTTGGSPNGPFGVELSSAKKYGFLRSEGGKVIPSERARKVLYPQSETDKIAGLREAVLEAPDISEVYNHYRGENLPDNEFFTNALRDNFGIPSDKIAEFLEIFHESMRSAQLLDESGERPRLIDVGRDEATRTAGSPSAKKISVAAGTSCFVMQPFGGHLGSYYESVFKPAIEQAGLIPIRADSEIFATGKVMDQVWRGIRQASVLVAELTTKNPNVFYELGLAHAQEKPVILVSSNQDDVPFDLRHIRVILYDLNDPFWGQKLIDKIAENIKSALTNPEEAIFRVEE
jgi:hypothetical protein